jgi:hypothetical protein
MPWTGRRAARLGVAAPPARSGHLPIWGKGLGCARARPQMAPPPRHRGAPGNRGADELLRESACRHRDSSGAAQGCQEPPNWGHARGTGARTGVALAGAVPHCRGSNHRLWGSGLAVGACGGAEGKMKRH